MTIISLAEPSNLPIWYLVLSGIMTIILGVFGPIIAKRIGAHGEISQDRRVDFNSIMAAQDTVIDKMQTRLDTERKQRSDIEIELWSTKEQLATCEGVLTRAGWKRVEGEWKLIIL